MRTLCSSGILFLLCAGAAIGSVRAVECFAVDCRGFGHVEVSHGTGGGLEVTEFSLSDAKRAMRLASKRLRDLRGFGDLRLESGNETVLTLDGVGAWGLGAKGTRVCEIFGTDAKAVRAAVRGRGLTPPTDRAYPRYLDCFDGDATAFWISGGGKKDELPFQFDFLREQGFAFCAAKPGLDRLVEEGVVDFSIFDYDDRMARKYGLGYRQLLFGAGTHRTWMWNRYPLPYARAANGYRNAPFCFRSFQVPVGYYEPTGFERHEWDFRRKLAQRYGGEDSPLLGWHGCDEIPTATINDLSSVARTPAVEALWRKNHTGDVPVAEDFLGGEPKLDLRGTWDVRATETNAWVKADAADMTVLLKTAHKEKDSQPFWMRRTFTVPKGGLSSYRYLHTAVSHNHAFHSHPPRVQVNGVDCPRVAEKVVWSHCFDVSGALKEGENSILLDTRSENLCGYCFLNATPLRGYFDMTEEENRRWFEAVEFSAELRIAYIEGNLRAIRSVDPERPIKLMATHSFYDHSLPLCRRYGAYQHDTGGAGAFWAPMQGDGYSRSHRLPFSCEQGGPPQDVPALRATISRYLNYGNSAVDLVFAITFYMEKPELRAWIEENAELFRAIGKMRQPDPRLAVLRSTRMGRFGFQDIWNWDIGRGTVQATGRTLAYLETCDLRDPRTLDRYDVIVDDATFLLTDEECAGLKAWVERGGTFVAQHHTGRHSVGRRDTWPLLRAFGVEKNDREVFGTRCGEGRFIRLGTPARAFDAAWFGRLFDKAGLPRDSIPPHPRLWGETFESKNGLYDLYLATYMTSLAGREDIEKTNSFSAAFCRATRPRYVRDFGVKGHPSVAADWADGILRIPERSFAGMESKLYAVPSDDPGGAAVRWIRAFAETWHPVEKVVWSEPPVRTPSDVIPLDSGWTHEGRTVSLGTYAAMGIPENMDAAFSRTVKIPAAWADREVELIYDAPFWFWGLYPAAELDVNGRPAPLDRPIRPGRTGSFAFDVTEAARTGEVRLDLRILPTQRTSSSMVSQTGSTGMFRLVCHPKAARTIPLGGPWYACLNVGDRVPVRPGERKVHNFYETTFDLPESDRGRRVVLRYSRQISGVAVNGVLLDLDKCMKRLDITGYVRFGEANTLRLVRWTDQFWPMTGAGTPRLEDCNPLGEAELVLIGDAERGK